MAQQATVFNPTTRERKVVNVGDPNAFTGGFVLETKEDNLDVRGRSLEGTLPPERTLGGTACIKTKRSLAVASSGTENFKDVLRQVSLLARSQSRQGPDQELARYAQAGVPLTAPSAISGALDAGTLSRREVEDTVFKGALDLIKSQE